MTSTPASSKPSHALTIGPHTLANNVVVAPMAGVTDLPFRELCLELGAGLAVAEMLTSDLSLTHSRKTMLRRQRSSHEGIRSVQIVGNDPTQLADAARFNADDGADIIDINMGCPAKKVCKKAAGSALLGDERLVAEILERVVGAVSVPVTLKIRTGIAPDQRNGVNIARIAEASGIQMLAVHGRTRADRFKGEAEYETIAAIVDAVSIPVLANGDITSTHKARFVLQKTGAAGVMIGRAAQGQPWLPGIVARELAGLPTEAPSPEQQLALMARHLMALHHFYGAVMGVRIARKHIGWFIDATAGCAVSARTHKSQFNGLDSPEEQLNWLNAFGVELTGIEVPVAPVENYPTSSRHQYEGQRLEPVPARVALELSRGNAGQLARQTAPNSGIQLL